MTFSYYFLIKLVINFSGRCFGFFFFYFITTRLFSRSICSCTRKDKFSGKNESKELELEIKKLITHLLWHFLRRSRFKSFFLKDLTE